MKMHVALGNAGKFLPLPIVICAAVLAASAGLGNGPFSSKYAPWIQKSSAANYAPPRSASSWTDVYGNLPLSFEENHGQTAQEVRYLSHGPGYEVFLASQEAVIAIQYQSMAWNLNPLHRAQYFRALRQARQAGRMTVLRMGFEGANLHAGISASDPLPGRVNYIIGNHPDAWHTNIPTYAKVRYSQIYPGVDLVFYGNRRKLEYDFVVAPGADPKAIALTLKGARHEGINRAGDLILSLDGGSAILQKPVVYQNIKGGRKPVSAGYLLDGKHRVTFSVPDYDRTQPLIIDPVLDYSTYLGGSATGDVGTSIAVDSNGDAFVTGQTFSTTFPTQNGFGAGNANGVAFVSELNPSGTAVLYSTYLGGTGGDHGLGIALDPSGNIYITGETFSTDFPTTPLPPPAPACPSSVAGLKQGPNLGAASGTSFISKINPTVSGACSLIYSSYLGGSGGTLPDFAQGVAADANGNVYVTGLTASSPGSALGDFPVTANAFQSTLGTTSGNAFLTKINATLAGASSLVYSTYLGGSGANAATLGFGDDGLGVALDASNNAYVIGTTSSTDFPTTANALQPNTAPPAAVANGTAFISRLDTTQSGASSLIYSTYLGGNSSEFGTSIAVKPSSTIAYVTGTSSSSTFPTFPANTFQTAAATQFPAAFVTLLDTSQPAGTALVYSTFLGGNSTTGFGISADSSGNAYVAGGTTQTTFPVTQGALQQAFTTGAGGEGFVSKINPAGNGAADLVYSTLFGGSGLPAAPPNPAQPDSITALAVDGSTNVYIMGVTFSSSATFPVFPPSTASPSAFQTSLPAGATSAAFIAKLSLIPTLVVAPSPFDFGTVGVGVASSPQAFTVTNNTSSGVTFNSITVTGVSPAANTDFAISSDGCSPSVAAGAPPCVVNVVFTPSVASAESATLVINATVTDGGIASAQVFNVNLTGTGAATAPAVTLAPTSLTFGNQQVGTTSAAQTIMLTNTGSAALTINSIAASGDFAATSTGATACPISPATLAAGANCMISVTFTPTAAGPRAGTLSVTDNASGSPHTASLSGTGTAPAPAVSLDHANVTFTTGQMVTTTSAATTVNLKNTGTGALTINASGISTTGDFTQTNNCPVSPQTLAAGLSCAIKVSFAPTATGARNGTLAIADNAAGSPQSIPLTGTGWDFSLSGPTTTQTATPSSSAKFNVTMTPLGGFNQFVALTCTATPPMTTCSAVSPISASDGTTPQQSQVTVSTSAMIVPPTLIPNLPLSLRQIVPLILLLALIFLLPRTRRIPVRLGIVALTFALLTIAACGEHTTTGTVTITGQSTGSAGSVSHSITVPLTTH